MQKRMSREFAAAALLLTFAAGCGKKSAPSRAFDLSMPSSSQRPASAPLAPEAAATGEQSPVKLTLRLYRKSVKRTGSLWVQVALANIGDRHLVVTDDCFYEPTALDVVNPKTARGVYVEIVDSLGKVMTASPPSVDVEPRMITYDQMTPEQRKGADIVTAKVRGWRAQGVSEDQIRLKVLDLSEEMSMQRREAEAAARTVALLPGQSIQTVAYADKFAENQHAPLGSYTEVALPYYFDLHPGRYRIRAVYDQIPHRCRRVSGTILCPSDDRVWNITDQRLRDYESYVDVRVETSDIDFEVVP